MTDVRPGDATRLGARWDGSGTNFAVFSSAGARGGAVTLSLLAADGSEERLRMWEEYDVWCCYVPGVGPGHRYGFRVPDRPDVLLDPYARAMIQPDPARPRSLQSVIVDES